MLHDAWVATKFVGRALRLVATCALAVGFMFAFGRALAGG